MGKIETKPLYTHSTPTNLALLIALVCVGVYISLMFCYVRTVQLELYDIYDIM